MFDDEVPVDKIGYWSEVKLDIIREYAAAYSTILAARTAPAFYHIYVDAFAGAGYHISRATGEFVTGSPLNALNISPPFREYHFIDLDRRKASALRRAIGDRDNVFVYEADCNTVLLDEILPLCRREDYRRALWLLDPYGCHYEWRVVQAAGKARSIDLFLNFPMMDMNRRVLWRDHERVSDVQRKRMTVFWGDDTWREVAYRPTPLFGFEDKADNIAIVKAYCERLRDIAGFGHVARPLALRNEKSAIIYYLLFASHRPVAREIVEDIFDKYQNAGAAG